MTITVGGEDERQGNSLYIVNQLSHSKVVVCSMIIIYLGNKGRWQGKSRRVGWHSRNIFSPFISFILKYIKEKEKEKKERIDGADSCIVVPLYEHSYIAVYFLYRMHLLCPSIPVTTNNYINILNIFYIQDRWKRRKTRKSSAI